MNQELSISLFQNCTCVNQTQQKQLHFPTTNLTGVFQTNINLMQD